MRCREAARELNMIRKLTPDDGRMVDLLLDRGVSTPDGPAVSQVFSNPQPDMFEKRLDSVEKIFGLLQMLPAGDPPMDLTSRTLARIEDPDSANVARPHEQGRPSAAQSRTHA